MDFPDRLTPVERERGKRIFRRFAKINGISVAVLMENILILYSIKNGLSDPQVAVIASFIHLTMPFMILGKRLVTRIGLARTWGLSWMLRYVSVSIITLAPVFRGSNLSFLTIPVIMIGAFGFALFRSMGAMNNTPLMGEITTARDRGRFISGNVLRSHSFYFLAMGAVIVVLWFSDALWVYQTVILVGCLTGLYASYLLTRVPESATPSLSARTPISSSLRKIRKNSDIRRLLLAWCAGFIFIAVTLPFAVITVKNGYGIPDHIALIYSLAIVGGGVFSSLFTGVLSDFVGPRPLLIFYSAGFFLFAIFWSFAPAVFLPVLTGTVFFLGGVCKMGSMVGLSHYFLNLVKSTERLGLSLLARIFSGASAGIAGSLVGGGLLSLLQSSGMAPLEVYRTYFKIISVFILLLSVLIYRLKALKDWKIRSLLGLLVSPRDMRALFVMNRLDKARNFDEDAQHVEKLGSIASNVSEPTIRAYLKSPDLSVRTRALRALRHVDISPDTEEALKRELYSGEHSTGWIAAEILGEHRTESAVPLLREALGSNDLLLRGKSMIALVKIGDTDSYDEIKRIFTKTENPREIIYGTQALVQMEELSNIRLLLEKSMDDSLPSQVENHIYMAVAALCGKKEVYFSFLREYRENQQQGLDFLFSLMQESHGSLEPEKLEYEIHKKKPLRYFKKILLGIAAGSTEENIKHIEFFLQHIDSRKIPRKLAFFLAILLHRSKHRSPPSIFSVD
jgi:hypothetical protein